MNNVYKLFCYYKVTNAVYDRNGNVLYTRNGNVRVTNTEFSLTTYIDRQMITRNLNESIITKSNIQYSDLNQEEQQDSSYTVKYEQQRRHNGDQYSFDSPVNFDDINRVKDIVNNSDFRCSLCSGFNRGWNCCGQFAPFFLIYYYFLHELSYNGVKYEFDDFFVLLRFSQGRPTQVEWLKNIAMGFYKMFTGYGASNATTGYLYLQTRAQINQTSNTNIPSIHDNSGYWLANTTELVDETSNLFVLQTRGGGIAHFGYIRRRGNNVIICDSWTHDIGFYDNNSRWIQRKGSRPAVTRVIKYQDYLYAVQKINSLCAIIPTEHPDNKNKLLFMYNFIMNSLFLIPYHNDSIQYVDFTFNDDNSLCKFYLVNNDSIANVLNLIIDYPDLYDAFIRLGGNKKEGGKSTKKRNQKRGKTQRKRLTN